jgi:hypothetical protein
MDSEIGPVVAGLGRVHDLLDGERDQRLPGASLHEGTNQIRWRN